MDHLLRHLLGGHMKKVVGVFIFIILVGCGSKKPATRGEAVRRGQPEMLDSLRTGDFIERGVASWYGHPFHGRQTSSGETYNMEALTAAHKTLPFQTLVKVTNRNNGKSVIVRINDRGPFVGNRIIDLSYKAAKDIEMIGPGTAHVELYLVEKPSPKEIYSQKHWVQVGSFSTFERARSVYQKLENLGFTPNIKKFDQIFRVRIGPFDSQNQAKRAAKTCQNAGFEVWMIKE